MCLLTLSVSFLCCYLPLSVCTSKGLEEEWTKWEHDRIEDGWEGNIPRPVLKGLEMGKEIKGGKREKKNIEGEITFGSTKS